ncbi:MAG: hypothetical protein WBP41_17310, partial [Saprospiraceae bacterium]
MTTQNLNAQNVLVSGAVIGNGLYPDLGSAFTAINGGAQTAAVIQVSILGNTTEATSATLNQGTWASLTISPSGGASRTISGSVAGPLVDLNGADNVNINGVNTGGNTLTIDNQNTGGSPTCTIRFIADATTNIIQNTTILGASTAVTVGTVFFSTSSGGVGNDNNTIITCIIDASSTGFPAKGILSLGTAVAGQENSGILISNNQIANYFSATLITDGILVGTGSTGWIISANKLFQSAPRTYTTANIHQCINVLSGNGYDVSNNTIGFASAAATGIYTMLGTIATRLIGINLAVGTTVTSSVNNNVISAISLATSSGATTTNGVICGINITAGNVEVGTGLANIIGGVSGTGLISAVPTTSGGLVVGINCSSTGTIVIQNNTIGGLFCSGTTAAVAGSITGVNVSGIAASMTITGNTIGNATANNMQGGTLGLTTGSSLVSGINLPSTPTTSTITNNTIQNLTSFGTGTTGFVRGIWTAAASGSAASYT